jgi:hypothetical protein
MNKKLIGVLSLISFVFVTLWIVLLIISIATSGPTDTFDQAFEFVSRLDTLFYLTYINATVLTILAVALMTGLYGICKEFNHTWSIIGLAFVPIYGVINVFAYFSQVALMPVLIPMQGNPDFQAAIDVWLSITMQILPGSPVNTLNNFAYAILGIPSIIFGAIIYKRVKRLRFPGILLAMNGITCIFGIIGILINNNILSLGSIVGGMLWWAALLPLGIVLSRE